MLIRSGLELLTETGFISTGIDAIVKNVQVPKGSFYYYFENKTRFGHEVLDAYGAYFAHKLDKFLTDESLPPLARLSRFIGDAETGMQKYAFRRGCLVGNLMQESPALPESFNLQLQQILADWQRRVAVCLAEAARRGDIVADESPEILAEQFWNGWEGAVMRARLYKSAAPLHAFWHYFQRTIIKPA